MTKLKMSALALATFAVIVGLGAAGYWFAYLRVTNDVAVPPDSASPQEVVEAYVAALDGRDCETAKALTVEGSSVSEPWCDDVESMTIVEIAGPSEPIRPGQARFRIGVTFDLDYRPLHYDVSLGDGRIDWGYLLERADPDSPWRIADDGLG